MPVPFRLLDQRILTANDENLKLYTVPNGFILELEYVYIRDNTTAAITALLQAVKGATTEDITGLTQAAVAAGIGAPLTSFLYNNEELWLDTTSSVAADVLHVSLGGWLWSLDELAYGVTPN